MISRRKRNSPGIELNEIDHSQYNQTQDYSFPNAPICLVTGFADKGEDYKTQWINSKNTFIEKYGYPTNTAEQYFFNAAMEILNRNAVLLTNKLPYNNQSKDNFAYIKYSLEEKNIDVDVKRIYKTIANVKENFLKLLNKLNITIDIEIINLKQIFDKLNEIKSTNDNINDIDDIIKEIENIFKQFCTDDLYQIFLNDITLTSYIDIQNIESNNDLITLEKFDNLITSKNVTNKNSITIVNISRNKYEKLKNSKNIVTYNDNNENYPFLGIVPVIVTPANALYYQKLLHKDLSKTQEDFEKYNLISSFSPRNIQNIEINKENITKDLFSIPLSSSFSIFDEENFDNSLSKKLVSYFPNILYNSDNSFDREHLKKIGIIVLKAYNDTTNDNRIGFEVLESFIGSLDKNARNSITNANEFIDNIVNSQSQYINIFTNIDEKTINNTNFISISNQEIKSLGFYKHECKKSIDRVESIVKPLNKMFGVLNNTTTSNIDIIVDAGMSNIAQYLTGEEEDKIYSGNEKVDTGVQHWFNIVKMFDDFCKYTRKDCIFIADAPRPFCLNGDSKIIRTTCPSNTIEKSILPNLKYLTGINSSYSTGYCDWFYCKDEYTGDFFWCPPSIKAAGAYCYTDIYFHKWDAPAGMYRGIVRNAYDVAFSPTDDEAGRIYQQTWNYAVNYPINGIILEGQKTFQKNQTTLDRVNVRRLLLHLEKQTARIARMFLYEGNTAYNRQRLVDMLTPIFEDAKNGNGLIEYLIKCDEENNTSTTIDRNELHVAIAVKPVKSIEYIILNFGITNQSTSISEEIKKI